MIKRALCIFLVSAALIAWPAAAQEEEIRAADYVPADFAGFIQLRLENPQETLRGLNIAAFVAAQLQPNRIRLGSNTLAYEDFIPFNTLFDVENTSFINNILPWLGDELVIAYAGFDGQLQTDSSDMLLIAPTSNVLDAAARLSTILRQQDLLVRQTYRGIDVYEGDKTSIALTSPAVFIGATDLIHAALDVQAGVAKAVTATPIYGALRAAVDTNPLLFAYVSGDHILPAVSGLVGGDPDSELLFSAFGAALAKLRPDKGIETLLLNQGFDGAAASVDTVIETSEALFTAKAVFHHADLPELEAETTSTFDATLLDMVPRNAFIVHSGSNISALVYDFVTVLPMSNFARQMLGGLPIQTLGNDSDLITLPDTEQVIAAVENYLAILEDFGGFDLEADLLRHLSGSYMLTLLPRPNNPVPVIAAPFDLLIVARVADEAALDGATALLQNTFDLDQLADETVSGWDFTRLGREDEVVFSLGLEDDTLIIGTGDAALRALDAQRGDNRLTDQPSWQTLSKTAPPDIYLETASFFNTLFPFTGGAVPPVENRTQLALHSTYLGNGLYELTLSALIPTGN